MITTCRVDWRGQKSPRQHEQEILAIDQLRFMSDARALCVNDHITAFLCVLLSNRIYHTTRFRQGLYNGV